VPVVAVVNRKGGSGKSTLATHLAAQLARRGTRVMLGDVDKQQSTVSWLRRRGAHALPGAPIVGWALDPKNVLRPPPGVTHVVLDTPGGLHGFEMTRLLMQVDAILIPLTDSLFDREAAAACVADLRAHPRVSSGRTQLAAVGMRIDGRTRGADTLRQWAAEHELPFVATLRTTQNYVRCAEHGLTVFDLPAAKVQEDLAQWQPLLDWLAPVLEAPPEAPVLQAPRLVANATPRLKAAPPAAPGARPPSGELAPIALERHDRPGALRRWIGSLGWFASPQQLG
jgi:chromosome partitioning protein